MSKEHWDKSFSDPSFVYGERENHFINNKSNIISDDSTIGCFAEGEGRNAVYLAKLGHDVTAFDQSTVGLEKTKTLAGKNNVEVKTVAMDLTKERVQANQFNAAIMVYGHVPKNDQKFFMENMVNSVKTGGILSLKYTLKLNSNIKQAVQNLLICYMIRRISWIGLKVTNVFIFITGKRFAMREKDMSVQAM